MLYRIRVLLIHAICWAVVFCGQALASEVCRTATFQGLEWRTKKIHDLLGPDTTDISKIKLFIGRDKEVPYIQSNFLSSHPEEPGAFSDFPTKLRSKNVGNIRDALRNIIFWSKMPGNADEIVEQALKTVEVYVDRGEMDNNGRIPIDIDGVKKIQLADGEKKPIETGEISTLRLKEPPPALVETIDGCCLKGRPPGRSQTIFSSLKDRKMSVDKVVVLPFVVDSGTEATVRNSKVLSAAQDRALITENDSWPDKLKKAIAASRGNTLVLLTHISGKNVEVLDPSQNVLFSISVSEIRTMAKEADVNLVLFGCDTATFIADAADSIGLAGKYNTASAAKRLGKALTTSSDVGELLRSVVSPDLVVVVYDERGGNGYAGASAFARVERTNYLARVFRILSMRGS